MLYEIEYKQTGKSFAQMLQIKNSLLRGKSCSLATINPEKVKRDFRYALGDNIELIKTEDKDVYSVHLTRSDIVEVELDSKDKIEYILLMAWQEALYRKIVTHITYDSYTFVVDRNFRMGDQLNFFKYWEENKMDFHCTCAEDELFCIEGKVMCAACNHSHEQLTIK